jgi:uncharacterized membrane protein
MMFSKTRALRHRAPVIAVGLVAIALSAACDDEESSTMSAGTSETTELLGFLLEGDVVTTIEPPIQQILTVPGQEPFELVDINNKGQMVGYYTDEEGVVRAFVREPDGAFETVDFPGAASTSLSEITDDGVLVGTYTDVADDPFTSHGFVRKDGEFTAVDVPDAVATSLGGLNEKGQMAGTYGDAMGRIHGFLLDDGELTTIDFPDAATTFAGKVNDKAQVVGFFSETETTLPLSLVSSYIWDQGEFTRIDVPDGLPDATVAVGINDDSQVVGAYARSSDMRSLGFLRDADGTYTPIDFPEADDGVGVFDINEHDQIVGIYGAFVEDEDG